MGPVLEKYALNVPLLGNDFEGFGDACGGYVSLPGFGAS